MSISLGSTNFGSLYLGSTKIGEAYLGSVKVYGSQPVLPAHTIRCKFRTGFTPSMGDTQTLVDADENIWDIYKSSTDWNSLFANRDLVSVIAANTTGVTNMYYMFHTCRELTAVPLFDTSSVTDMDLMFFGCTNVQSGALALYQQASSQTNPPIYHDYTFTNCGRDTVTGAAELAQIPTAWGGTGA